MKITAHTLVKNEGKVSKDFFHYNKWVVASKKYRIPELFVLTKKVLKGIEKKKFYTYFDFLALVLIISLAIVYSFMSLNNHRLFETFGWDLAVFDNGIWQWSMFKFPYSTFHDLYWLADHFHLILLIIVPLYWVWSNVKLLLIIQAFVTCFGALPLYFLSKKVTRHRIFSLVIVLGYLLFYSLQWHTFSGFHELAFLPLTLGSALYFWESKNYRMYWVSIILSLLVKEEIGFLVASFGVWIFIKNRTRRKESLLTILLGISYSLLMTSVVMPYIGGGGYRHSGFGESGDSVLDVTINVIRNPFILIKAFVDSGQKLQTMFVTFWPWIFLPIFAPSTLILVFEQFASRFLDYVKVIRWTPYFAYSLPMATIMAWGSIYGFNNLTVIIRKIINKKSYLYGTYISLLLFSSIVFENYILHAPINSIFKKEYYRTEPWMNNNLKILECIPKDKEVSVSIQNSLAPHVSQRYSIKVFPEGLNQGYEYIVVDLHEGQSENSFHFLGREKTRYIIDDLIKRRLYKVICKEGDSLVLKKLDNVKVELDYPFEIEIFER